MFFLSVEYITMVRYQLADKMKLSAIFKQVRQFFKQVRQFFKHVRQFFKHVRQFFKHVRQFFKHVRQLFKQVRQFFKQVRQFFKQVRQFFKHYNCFKNGGQLVFKKLADKNCLKLADNCKITGDRQNLKGPFTCVQLGLGYN